MKRVSAVFFILILAGVGLLLYTNRQIDTKIKTKQQQVVVPTVTSCKPTFVDGGGPYYLPNAPFRDIIVPEGYTGEPLIVSGKLYQNDCQTPVGKAVIDIWQANEDGEYVNDWYRGQIITDENGNYRFHTVIPKGYGEGTGYRPPHIHFKVFIDQKEIITSQMFFPEIAGTDGFDNAYIMKVETKDENGIRVHYGTHNIILP